MALTESENSVAASLAVTPLTGQPCWPYQCVLCARETVHIEAVENLWMGLRCVACGTFVALEHVNVAGLPQWRCNRCGLACETVMRHNPVSRRTSRRSLCCNTAVRLIEAEAP